MSRTVRWTHPAAHHPHRLGAAGIRGTARSGLPESSSERDRGVQAVLPSAQPGCRRGQDHRRRPAARGDEYHRQEGQARRAHPLRGLGRHAHRGLGRQHRHPHPRCPPVPQPAAVRAGRRPRPAAAQLRRQPRHWPVRARVRRGVRRAVRVHPQRPADPQAPRPPPRGGGTGTARTVGPGHPLPQAGRLPRRAARRDPPRRLRRRLAHAPRPGHGGPVGQEPGSDRRRSRGRPRRHPQRTHAAHRVRHRQDPDRAGGVLRRTRRRAATLAVPAARRHHPAMARPVRHHRSRESRRGIFSSPRPERGPPRRCSPRSSGTPGAGSRC